MTRFFRQIALLVLVAPALLNAQSQSPEVRELMDRLERSDGLVRMQPSEALEQCNRAYSEIDGIEISIDRISLYLEAGNVYKHLKSYQRGEQAFLTALDESKRENLSWGVIRANTNLGDLLRWKGELIKAIGRIDVAVGEARVSGERDLLSRALNVRGNIYRGQRNWEMAMAAFSEAVILTEELGDQGTLARLRRNQALCYKGMGFLEESLIYHRIALDLFRNLGERHSEALTLEAIAFVHRKLGNFDEAIDDCYLSLEILKEIKDPKTESKVLGYLTSIHRRLGYYDKALENAQASLKVAETSFDRSAVVLASTNLALVYELLSKYDEALVYLNRALAMSDEIDNQKYLASAYKNAGSVYEKMSRPMDALLNLRKALEYYGRVDNVPGLASTYGKLAPVMYQLKDYDEALRYYDLALRLHEKRDDMVGLAEMLIAKGNLALEIGHEEKGAEELKRGTEIAESIAAKSLLPSAYRSLFEYAASIGDEMQSNNYARKFMVLQDEINSQNVQTRISDLRIISAVERKQREIDNLQARSEIDALQLASRQQEIDLLNKERRISELQLSRAKTLRIFWISLSIAALIMLMALYSRFRAGKKHENELLKKNRLIERSNEQLEKANEAKNKFFSIVAHDLRNSVSSLVRGVGLVEEKPSTLSQTDYQRVVRSVKRSASQTYALLENMLRWARMQMQGLSENIEANNLFDVMSQIVEAVHEDIERKELIIRMELDEQLEALADSYILQTTLRNLLSNAIKFSRRAGTIRLIAQIDESESTVSIHVIDEGVGVSLQLQERLFRIDRKRSAQGTAGELGTGMGLILCQDMLHRIGSEIRLESEVGKGSDFYFHLPVVRESILAGNCLRGD